MTTYTENFNLGKQTDHSDMFSMDVITDNMDKIDSCLKNMADRLEELEKNSGRSSAGLMTFDFIGRNSGFYGNLITESKE